MTKRRLVSKPVHYITQQASSLVQLESASCAVNLARSNGLNSDLSRLPSDVAQPAAMAFLLPFKTVQPVSSDETAPGDLHLNPRRQTEHVRPRRRRWWHGDSSKKALQVYACSLLMLCFRGVLDCHAGQQRREAAKESK